MVGEKLSITQSNEIPIDEYDLIINMYQEYRKRLEQEQKA